MTWNELTTGLRQVQTHGTTQARIGLALFELDLIQGSQADNSGLMLTAKGEDLLRRIARDSAELVRWVETVNAFLYFTAPARRPDAIVVADSNPKVH